MAIAEELYQCEVKRTFVIEGKRSRRWVAKPVTDVELGDEFRCKDCHGAVKLHGKHLKHGPAAHGEHRIRTDSEYCPSGHYFKQATDAREPRLSATPIL
jgi:hypothetical protein